MTVHGNLEDIFRKVQYLEKAAHLLQRPHRSVWFGAKAGVYTSPLAFSAWDPNQYLRLILIDGTPLTPIFDVLIPSGRCLVVASAQFVKQPTALSVGMRVSYTMRRYTSEFESEAPDSTGLLLPGFAEHRLASDDRAGIAYDAKQNRLMSHVAGVANIEENLTPGLWRVSWAFKPTAVGTSSDGFLGDPIVLIVVPL